MKTAKLFDLSGKVAVITGSGKGIGKGIAKLLSESGAKVVLCSRTKEDVEEVAREITGIGGTAFPQYVMSRLMICLFHSETRLFRCLGQLISGLTMSGEVQAGLALRSSRDLTGIEQ